MLPGRGGWARDASTGRGLGVTRREDVLDAAHALDAATLEAAGGGGLMAQHVAAVQRLLRDVARSSATRTTSTTRPGDPRAAQEAQAARDRRGATQDTDYGREHGFGAIRSIEDYRARVPPNTYETLEPYIERDARAARRTCSPPTSR